MSGSNASMTASLTLRLQDRLSAGLGALKGRLDGIRASAERIGALGAIGGGLALGAPIVAAANLDKQLRDMAVTAGFTGLAAEEFVNKLRNQFQKLALETAQTSRDVAAAAGLMMQRGLASDLIERMLPITAKVATGTSSAIQDVAGVVYDLNQTLDVTPDKMDRALSMLVQSAREGKVELRDMAREFPALASAANNFGLKGLEGIKILASAMQTAAKASANPGEAANNLANLFQSLTRPDTRKNFAKMGVDLEKLKLDAIKKGINPLEAVIAQIIKLTKGPSQGDRLGELIGDMQAGRALLPFLKDVGAYLDLREKTGRADPIIIDQSFETMVKGASAQIGIFTERLQQLSDRLGGELFGRVGGLSRMVGAVQEAMDEVDATYPRLIGNTIRLAAMFLALVTTVSTAVVALPFLAAGFNMILLPLKMLFAPVMLLVRALTFIAGALGLFAAPVIAVVAVLALIGAIAYTIWDRWEDLQGYFTAMWRYLRIAAGGFLTFLDGLANLDMPKIVTGIEEVWSGLGDFFNTLWLLVRNIFNGWVDGIGEWVGGSVGSVVDWFRALWDDAATAVNAAFQRMTEVLSIWWEGLKSWVTTEIAPIIDAFKGLWQGLQTWFEALWASMSAPIDRWFANLSRVWSQVRGFMGLSAAGPQPTGATPAGEIAAPVAPLRGGVHVTVTAAEGTRAEVTGTTAGVEASVTGPVQEIYRQGRGPMSPSGRP